MIKFDEHIFQIGWNHQPVLIFQGKNHNHNFQGIYIDIDIPYVDGMGYIHIQFFSIWFSHSLYHLRMHQVLGTPAVALGVTKVAWGTALQWKMTSWSFINCWRFRNAKANHLGCFWNPGNNGINNLPQLVHLENAVRFEGVFDIRLSRGGVKWFRWSLLSLPTAAEALCGSVGMGSRPRGAVAVAAWCVAWKSNLMTGCVTGWHADKLMFSHKYIL